MKFLVITNAPSLLINNQYEAYAPYVTEMDLWFKYANEAIIISPTVYQGKLLTKPFKKQPQVISIPSLGFKSFQSFLRSIFNIPIILMKLFAACKNADHIHLRCPGNIGLLGCLVQVFFPNKVKTAKYAGNWNPKAKQPISYNVQKWLLFNTFLTKRMSVLVYGHWKKQTKNIKSFFTATFYDSEREAFKKKDYSQTIKFLFVGSLVKGKRPLFAIKLIEQLFNSGINCELHMFGEGVLKTDLEAYISQHQLNYITLHGNQSKETIKEYLLQSHFSILASKSEGWPKALAEAMFFGVIPIATKISCVPYMLGYGERGILIEPKLKSAQEIILSHLHDVEKLYDMSLKALTWSQTFTLDYFESEIKQLMVN